jgi:hypothetical protein
MGNAVSFSIDTWAAWAPGLEDAEAWKRWASDSDGLPKADLKPDVSDLPAGLRRRLSRLGKMALRVALDCGQADTARIVFSSRNGNVTQMLKLLQSISVNDPVSPTGFGMSVHNSLVGMLSIITKNTSAQTAVAAGPESFCMGLMEALTLLHEDPDHPVLLIHCDEPLPDFYNSLDDEVPICALAVVLKSETEQEETMKISFAGHATDMVESDPVESFLRFLITSGRRWDWRGGQGVWQCERYA